MVYLFGLRIRQALMWFCALSPSGIQQPSLIENIGSINSLLTLLFVAIVALVGWLRFRHRKKFNIWLVNSSLILVGVYFGFYDLVSV